MSVFFSLAAAGLLYFKTYSIWGLLACALCIQGRLLCNLLDGMVAIEGGKKTLVGTLYNEYPDRIADSILFITLGYVIHLPWLGWLGALLAMMTAYIRVLGGALGLEQSFIGLMAKPHRMALMTVACCLSVIEHLIAHTNYVFLLSAVLIVVGCLLTCIVRTRDIATRLGEKGENNVVG
jgi:phosphatidylglycerophosphate synthase